MRKLIVFLMLLASCVGCQVRGRMAVVGDSIAHLEIEELNAALAHRDPRDLVVPWAAVPGGMLGRDGAAYERTIRAVYDSGERADAAFVSFLSNDMGEYEEMPWWDDRQPWTRLDSPEKMREAIDRILGVLPDRVFWLAPCGPALPPERRAAAHLALEEARARWPGLQVLYLPEDFYSADGVHLSPIGEVRLSERIRDAWDAVR